MTDVLAAWLTSLRSALATNAIIAFMLNVVSFQTNKVAGALTLAVAGNVKQCLAILLGIVLFNVEVRRWIPSVSSKS